jgi:hypothetical protein
MPRVRSIPSARTPRFYGACRNAYGIKPYLADHCAIRCARAGKAVSAFRVGDKKMASIETETGCRSCLTPGDFRMQIAYTTKPDHVIFVGEVINFDHDPKGKPLVFWRGGYHKAVS